VSLEGTAASLAGALLMALVLWGLGLLRGPADLAVVVAAGMAATLLESLVGATLQRRWVWLTNELVNGLQTLLAALLALLLVRLIPG
jgi:uncharacterized protein (TIGR00297 family)